MRVPDQWKSNNVIDNKRKKPQMSSQKCSSLVLRDKVSKLLLATAPAWQHCSLSQNRCLRNPPSSAPQTQWGVPDPRVGSQLPQCQRHGRGSRVAAVPCPPAPWSGCAACPAARAGPPRSSGAAWCRCPAAPQKPEGREGRMEEG